MHDTILFFSYEPPTSDTTSASGPGTAGGLDWRQLAGVFGPKEAKPAPRLGEPRVLRRAVLPALRRVGAAPALQAGLVDAVVAGPLFFDPPPPTGASGLSGVPYYGVTYFLSFMTRVEVGGWVPARGFF